MEMTLDCLRPGCRGVVTDMDVQAALRPRLRDFGMVPGTCVCCRYRSPEGRVTALEVRGAVIALRTWDLRCIRVRI